MAGDVKVTVALDGYRPGATLHSVARDVTSAGECKCLTSKAVFQWPGMTTRMRAASPSWG
jgi:hypothetical protein